MRFMDAAPLTGVRRTADGYLTGRIKCARTGVQTYLRKELALDGDPNATIAVYRPPEAVFHKDSLSSYGGKPVVMGHPVGGVVDAANWRALSVGSVGSHIARDGETVVVDFALMDAEAITAVENGTKEVSMGYTSKIDVLDGVTPDGESYGAVITGPIKINHLAVVPKARGGESLRIGDSAISWGATPVHQQESDMTMKSVVLGDAAVQVAVADAQHLEAYRTSVETRMGELTAQVKTLTDAQLTDAQLSARVAERVKLETTARLLDAEVVCDGVADDAIRSAIVAKHFGDEAVQGQSPAHIAGMFAALSVSKPENGMRKVIGDSMTNTKTAPGAWGENIAKAAGVTFKKGH